MIVLAGKCPFMHGAAVEDTQLKTNGFVGCACDYQEGAFKKDATVESGNLVEYKLHVIILTHMKATA